MDVKGVRHALHELYRQRKNDTDMVELIGASFLADEPAILGEPNQDYIDREIAWYLSGSLKVADIPPPIPKIWDAISSMEDGEVNSNYGYLLHDPANGSQYRNVLKELSSNPTGRRATAIYTRPSMHTDWQRDGMSDFICTNAVNYFIRNNAVHAVVQMRSNDVVFGYRNDYAWQKHVQLKLKTDLMMYYQLHVDIGDIIWQAASLHVYPRHFHLLEAM